MASAVWLNWGFNLRKDDGVLGISLNIFIHSGKLKLPISREAVLHLFT